MMSNWFESWFNTPYYHILYQNRDEKEASQFLDNLVAYLKIEPPASVLDVACGKGRHAIYLNKLGFNVVGIDIAPNNIYAANEQVKLENLNNINFYVRDMRHPYLLGQFDWVCNLFTSIGYFENHEDNQQVIAQCSQALLPNGKFVLDFFNPDKVIKNLKEQEIKKIEGVEFFITRKLESGFILKTIEIRDTNEVHTFYEKVKAIQYDEFMDYFMACNLACKQVFGSYQLEDFESNSDRMIFVLEKIIR